MKPTDIFNIDKAMTEGYDMDQVRRDAEASLKKSIDRQSDARIAAAKEPKPGFLQQVGQKQIGMIKGAVKGAMTGLRGEPLEEVNPHNYDSDEDYYAALNAPARSRSSSRSRYDPDEVDFMHPDQRRLRADQERLKKARIAADHERLATGTNEADQGISKAKETDFHEKLDKLVHSTFGKRKGEMEEAGISAAELQMEIRELQRQANAEMVAQNSKGSVGRNYQKADMMYARIRELESQLRRKQSVAEARAATASFRSGNKKRAELNAMSDEERRAHDKEQQEKQRKRDDARLERERQKLAAKKKVSEAPDYSAMYDHKLMEMGVGSVATIPSVGGGTLFGGSYQQKNNPFKKKTKKSGMIKR